MSNEIDWNEDLIGLLRNDLLEEFPNINITKGKILKDIFLSKDDGYSLQFGFVDQDIIIYDESMDISDFENVKNIFLHNIKNKRDPLIIPKIIIELKYNGVNSHGLITYSNYATEIKSIFPKCRYYLVMKYKASSSDNKLFRHGRSFDKIIYFDKNSNHAGKYREGQFSDELNQNMSIRNRYSELLTEIKNDLRERKTSFVKY